MTDSSAGVRNLCAHAKTSQRSPKTGSAVGRTHKRRRELIGVVMKVGELNVNLYSEIHDDISTRN